MTNNIKIIIQLCNGSSSLKAYAHLTFQTPFCEITINRFKVFEKDDGELWVALPSESFMKEDQRIFIPIIDIPKHVKRELGEKIISEYKNKINNLCQS